MMWSAEVVRPADNPTVKIATGLLLLEGRVLLAHRTARRAAYPDRWALIGGHVEPGERPEDALRRECEEEVGVRIREFTSIPMANDDPHIEMHAFLVTTWSGEPTNLAPDEHDELRWFAPADLADLPLAHPEARGDIVRAATRSR